MKISQETLSKVNNLVQDAAVRHAPCSVWVELFEDGFAIRGKGHDRGSVEWTIESWDWADVAALPGEEEANGS